MKRRRISTLKMLAKSLPTDYPKLVLDAATEINEKEDWYTLTIDEENRLARLRVAMGHKAPAFAVPGTTRTIYIQGNEVALLRVFHALWAKLHTAAIAGQLTLDWLKNFTLLLPCGDCRGHWRKILAEIPFDSDDQPGWSRQAHNAVNVLLGKPQWTEEMFNKRWIGGVGESPTP